MSSTNRGDATVLPELKKAFDDYPEFVVHCGDLVRLAERALLDLAAGSSLAVREAIARQVAALRERLAATATSELERLLVDRVVISWLEVYHSDIDLAGRLVNQPEASAATQAAQKRLDRAHQRYLTAIKSLATVQKLVRPPLSPFDLAQRSIPETTTPVTNRRTGACPKHAGRTVAN